MQNVVTPNFAPKTKIGISASSTGICLAKCLAHNMSTTMRDRAMVSKDYLQETVTAYQEWNDHVIDDVMWPEKGQGRDPEIVEAYYLNNRARYVVGSYWLPVRNRTLRVQWSRERWRLDTKRSRSWLRIFELFYGHVTDGVMHLSQIVTVKGWGGFGRNQQRL